jgi:hypothetical protein
MLERIMIKISTYSKRLAIRNNIIVTHHLNYFQIINILEIKIIKNEIRKASYK